MQKILQPFVSSFPEYFWTCHLKNYYLIKFAYILHQAECAPNRVYSVLGRLNIPFFRRVRCQFSALQFPCCSVHSFCVVFCWHKNSCTQQHLCCHEQVFHCWCLQTGVCSKIGAKTTQNKKNMSNDNSETIPTFFSLEEETLYYKQKYYDTKKELVDLQVDFLEYRKSSEELEVWKILDINTLNIGGIGSTITCPYGRKQNFATSKQSKTSTKQANKYGRATTAHGWNTIITYQGFAKQDQNTRFGNRIGQAT